MIFEPCYTVRYGVPRPADLLLVLNRAGQVLLQPAQAEVRFAVPEAALLNHLVSEPALLLGNFGGQCCYGAVEPAETAVAQPPLVWSEFREALVRTEQPVRHLLLRGKAMLEWVRQRRRCGVCGAELENSEREEARICPNCGAAFFPKISPAIIVGVRRGDEILLAHNRRFRDKVYSFIAGFIEPGESAEAAVERELAEEVGVRVRNIRYWGSQSWPFPDSLMLGFWADYAGGGIHPDGEEIETAGFYRRDALPPIPRPGSIARRMIEAWLREQNG